MIRTITTNPQPTDLVLGRVVGNRRHLLVLPPELQTAHGDIYGKTGSGKTRFLQSWFLQAFDKRRGGVCFFDLHHDASMAIVKYLTERNVYAEHDSFNRLIYLRFGTDSVVPFNVLATGYSPKTIALQTLSAVYRCWPTLRQAASFSVCWLSGVACLAYNKLPLTRLYQLFTDESFRRTCLQHVPDPLIHQTLARFADNRQDTAALLRRSFLLTFSDVSRLSLSMPALAIDFRSMMDSGTSVLLDLGGIEDDETKRLIAALLLVQLEQAALSRSDIEDEPNRLPYTVLLDEWPAYAASSNESLEHLLNQSRKMGIRIILAAQSMQEIAPELLDGALENCKLHVAFGLGLQSAHKQSQRLAAGVVPQRSFFSFGDSVPIVPTRADLQTLEAELQTLDTALAYVKIHNQPAIKVRTLEVPNAHPNPQELEHVLATYKSMYHVSRAVAEAHVATLFPPPASPPPAAAPYTFFAEDEQEAQWHGLFTGSDFAS